MVKINDNMNLAAEAENPHLEESPSGMQNLLIPALEEVLGRDILNKMAGRNIQPEGEGSQAVVGDQPSENLGFGVDTIQSSLEKMFGQQAGSGLTLRIGRACFKYLLQSHGSTLGLTAKSFRLLPLTKKLDTGSKAIIEFLSKTTLCTYQWEKTDRHYSWQISNAMAGVEKTENRHICMFVAGLLQEAFYWMSGGRTFKLVEKCCHDPTRLVCTILIERIPID